MATGINGPESGKHLLRRFFLLSLAALGLSACGGRADTVSPTEKAVTERILFANTKLPEPKEAQRVLGCPAATILDGTAAYRVGEAGSARGVSHQAAILDLARECRPEGNVMRIKVGVQGRLILGDSGRPGTYTIPVRIAVRGDGKVLQSKLLPTAVTVPPDDTLAPFVTIDDTITVPITAEDPAEQYTILVGLDPQGAPRERRRRR